MKALLQEQTSRLKRHLIEHLNFRDRFGEQCHLSVIEGGWKKVPNSESTSDLAKRNSERSFLPGLPSKYQITKKVELPSSISEPLVARSSHTMRIMKSVPNEGQIKSTVRV